MFRKVRQHERRGAFLCVTRLATQPVVASGKIEFHMRMVKGIRGLILPRQGTNQRKIRPQMFRMTLLAGDWLVFQQMSVVARARIQLCGNFDMAVETTHGQAFVRMTLLAGENS